MSYAASVVSLKTGLLTASSWRGGLGGSQAASASKANRAGRTLMAIVPGWFGGSLSWRPPSIAVLRIVRQFSTAPASGFERGRQSAGRHATIAAPVGRGRTARPEIPDSPRNRGFPSRPRADVVFLRQSRRAPGLQPKTPE